MDQFVRFCSELGNVVYIMFMLMFSVGAVRTATWAVAGPSLGKFVDTVFQRSNGNITTISAHKYGRLKALQSGGAKGRPSDASRDTADTSLVAETDPMIVDAVNFNKCKR